MLNWNYNPFQTTALRGKGWFLPPWVLAPDWKAICKCICQHELFPVYRLFLPIEHTTTIPGKATLAYGNTGSIPARSGSRVGKIGNWSWHSTAVYQGLIVRIILLSTSTIFRLKLKVAVSLQRWRVGLSAQVSIGFESSITWVLSITKSYLIPGHSFQRTGQIKSQMLMWPRVLLVLR